MKNLSIRLKGFTGIKKGLGRDEIALDLSLLNGLTAIAGPNGFGKSTLIENLHPFRILASRKGALAHHVFLRDAVKEYAFAMDGHTFQTVLKIDNHSERQEAFIYKDGKAKSETNGKVSEYDKYIKDLFGSSNLFFNSVFCPQNSKKISQLTPGALTKLFIEFLGHEKYEMYKDTSNKSANIIAGKRFDLAEQKNKLADKILELATVEDRIAHTVASKKEYEEKLKHEKDVLKSAREGLEIERKNIINNDQLQIKINALQKELDDDIISGNKDNDQTSRKLTELREKARVLCDQIKVLDEILNKKDEISAAGSETKKLDQKIADCNENIKQVVNLIEKNNLWLNGLRKDHAETTEKYMKQHDDLVIKINELRIYERDLVSCRENIKALDARDPDCQSQTCSFIVSALEAEKKIPELEKACSGLKELDEKSLTLLNKRHEFEAQYQKDLAECTEKADFLIDQKADLEKALTAVELKKTELAHLSEKQGEIDVAQAKKDNLNDLKGEIIEEGIKISEELEARNQERKKKDSEIVSEIKGLEFDLNIEAQKQFEIWEKAIEQYENSVSFIEIHIANLDSMMRGLDKDLETKIDLEAQIKEIDARDEFLSSEASQWIYIKNGCSKDGLQALEIEAIAPEISENANSLLSSAFGPLSTIDFKTLDEDGKETLKIRVIDEDGEDVLLDNRSGGQQVWALKALRLAMTMISKEKSGRDFKTFFSDEEDGALSVENAEKFINLYRALMSQGGFDDCVYISHKSECISMADNRIEFNQDKTISIL